MNEKRPETADIVVTGGVVVNAAHREEASIVIKDGRIVALLGPEIPLPAANRVIDVAGQFVLPGGVDPHCHIGEAVGEFAGQDNYEEASIAALHGGTTTLVNFAIPEGNETPLEAAHRKKTEVGGSRIDNALHGGIITWDNTVADQVVELAKMGIRTVKMFTTYKGERMAEPETVLEVLRSLHEHHGMGYIHAEADHVIQDATSITARTGSLGPESMPGMRPELAENAAVAEILATAQHLQAPVYFVHQSTPEAVLQVRKARRNGLKAYTETCPHYLLLDSSRYADSNAEAFVCCPPLRDASTRAGLIQSTLVGDVDTIGSDHCCFTLAQKQVHRDDVRRMPNGMPGVETRIPATYTALVQNAGLSLERFVALTSTNAARLNGLKGKGVIAVGADADLYAIDPNYSRTAHTDDLHMTTDYTPYEGMTLNGWPRMVISSGRLVLENGTFTDPGEIGRFIETEPLSDSLLT